MEIDDDLQDIEMYSEPEDMEIDDSHDGIAVL